MNSTALTRKQAIAMAEAALGHPLKQKNAAEPFTLPAHERAVRSHLDMLIAVLAERDGTNCYLCRQPLALGAVCVEHIIPLCRGGTNAASNIALACTECNARKANNYVSLAVTSGAVRYHR